MLHPSWEIAILLSEEHKIPIILSSMDFFFPNNLLICIEWQFIIVILE